MLKKRHISEQTSPVHPNTGKPINTATTKPVNPATKKQEPIKAPEPVKKQVNVSDLDPQYQPNVQYNIPNKNTSNVQSGQPTQTSGQVQGSSTQSTNTPQKARVIKTIHPKDW